MKKFIVLFLFYCLSLACKAQTTTYSYSGASYACSNYSSGSGIALVSSQPSNSVFNFRIAKREGGTCGNGPNGSFLNNVNWTLYQTGVGSVGTGTTLGSGSSTGYSTQIQITMPSSFLSGTRTYYATMVSGGITFTTGNITIVATSTCNLLTSGSSASNITSSSFTANWNSVSGATGYQVSYTLNSDVNYSSPLTYTQTSISRTFSNLSPSTSYRYRVRTQCSNGLYGSWYEVTNITTSAPPQPTVSITTPTSGTWAFGQNNTVSWTTTNGGCAPYMVEVSTNGGSSWTLIGNQISGTSMTWTVGKDYQNNPIANMVNNSSLRLKVYCLSNTSVSSTSGSFSLATPTLSVTTPPSLTTGQSQSITWTLTNATCAQYTIELSTNGGSTPWSILKTYHPSSPFSWTVPNDQNGASISAAIGSTTNRIKVYCTEYSTINGTSNNFSISNPAPVITPTQPFANNAFPKTQANGAAGYLPIRWSTQNWNGNINIELRRASDNGYVMDLPSQLNDGIYDWEISSTLATGEYKLLLYPTGTTGYGAYTSNFKIFTYPTPTAPANNATLAQTSGINFAWNKNNPSGLATYEFKIRNTTTNQLLIDYTSVGDVSSYTPSLTYVAGNSYTWVVRSTSGTNNATSEEAPQNFTIASSVTVSSPAANSSYQTGTSLPIAWAFSGYTGNVSIELTQGTTGTTAYRVIADPTANDGSESWIIPIDIPIGQYRVKVYNAGSGSIVNYSGVFNITANPNCPNCLSAGITEANFPNTGNEGFCAAQYLCNLGIIQPQQNNAGYTPVDPIKRADLAKLMLYALLDDGFAGTYHQNPSILTFSVDSYVTPFEDLNYSNNTSSYDRPAKIMSYLYWSNDSKGLTPFKRTRTNFYPYDNITRMDFLQVLLEAWNVSSDATNSVPFTDDFSNVPEETMQYIKKAYSLGIITHSATNPHFRPYDDIKREEAFTILARLRKLNTVTKPSQTSLTNAGNYLFERNITTDNVSIMRSMGEGNFAFAEDGFSIPDIGIPLSFGFSYNSFGTQLPDVYRRIEPLGVGWTHNLNSYIQTTTASVNEGNVVVGKALLLLANGDGTWHTYDNSNPNAPVKRSIDNFNTLTVVTNSSTTYYEVKRPDLVTFKYEKQGSEVGLYRLTSIKDRHGNTLSIVYKNGASVPFSGYSQVIDYVQSPSGRRAVFTYNTSNQITEISFPGKTSTSPRRLKFEYYAGWDGKSNYLRKFTSARHYGTVKGTTYTYGTGLKKYLLESIKRPKGNEIKTEFGTDNKLQKIEEKNGTSTANTTTIARTTGGTCPLGTTCATVTNADGTVTSQKINLVGTIYEITSPTVNLALPEYSANPSNPAFFEVNGKRTKYQYNALGMVLRVDYLMPDKVTTHSYETFTYNTTYNNLESHRDPNGNTTYFDFSADGKYLNGIRKPFANNNQYINQTFTYYANGLLKEAINHELITTKFYYDSYGNNNRIEFPLLNLNSYASHDYAGRVETITNAKNKVSTFEHDDNDNLTKTIAPSPLSYVTQYGFDDNDLLNTITNAKGKVTTIGRDNFDRVETITFEAMQQKYYYRADGKLDKYEKTGFATNNNRYFQYAYDAQGRMTSNRYLTNVTFDNTTKNIQTITGGTSALLLKDFTFDELNRPTGYTDNNNIAVGYGYDNNGNVTRIDYPYGHKVYYTYDQANRLRTVKWNSTTVATYVYVGSRLSYVEYGNGVRTTYNYDNAGRLDRMTTKTNNGSGSTIAGYTFEFDNLGNHLTENITEPYSTIPTPPASTTTYTYKTNNQIETAGNITFTHDGDGNIITKGGLTYTYDLEDNLISMTGNGLNISFEYDAMGNRRIATRNSTVTKYVLDMLGMTDVLAELNGTNVAQNYYIHGLGLVARVKSDGSTIHYYHADFRGSVVAMTNASQTITHKYQYDEYGNLTNSQEADPNPFRYVGTYGIMYETADLSYMRARYYDPTTGRFNSEDPIWSANLYPYAANNPVMNIDPSGLVNWGLVGMGALGIASAALAIPTGGASLLTFGVIAGGIGIGVPTFIIGFVDPNEDKMVGVNKALSIAGYVTNPITMFSTPLLFLDYDNIDRNIGIINTITNTVSLGRSLPNSYISSAQKIIEPSTVSSIELINSTVSMANDGINIYQNSSSLKKSKKNTPQPLPAPYKSRIQSRADILNFINAGPSLINR